MNNDDSAIFRPRFDLGDFRYAVAKYVKLLIRARWKDDPGFLTSDQLKQWELSDISDDAYSATYLIGQAAFSLADLNQRFLPRCGSGGVKMTDEASPVGRLIFALSYFADCEGGGPDHNGALLNAAKRADNGEAIGWPVLVRWEELDAIRADLDNLPHPGHQPVSQGNLCNRLTFDDQSLTITLDGAQFEIENPKAYFIFKTIATLDGKTINSDQIRKAAPGTEGKNTISHLKKQLPAFLRDCIHERGRLGHWLQLPKQP